MEAPHYGTCGHWRPCPITAPAGQRKCGGPCQPGETPHGRRRWRRLRTLFDSAGKLVPSDLDDRVVGIDPDTLRKIPRRIGIAGGENKQTAIHAAVIGGWVNVLISDTGTAAGLLQRA